MNRGFRALIYRLIEKGDQWSLQTRLILAYVLIMLIPSILVSFILFNQFTGSAIKDAEKKNENTLEIERININNNIETMVRTAQLTLLDQDVKDYLSLSTDPATYELISFNLKTVPAIIRLQYNNPNIEHIRIFFDNPLINEMYPVFWKQDRVMREPWFPQAMHTGGADYWQFSPNDPDLIKQAGVDTSGWNRPKVSLFQEIDYPLGEHAGILEVDMLMSSFFPKTFGSGADDQSQIVLYDREGRLFYNKKQALFADTGVTHEQLLAALDLSSRKPMETTFRFNIGGKPFLGISSKIEPLDARMVNIVSLEDVLQNMNRTRNLIIAANMILIAILSVATYFMNALILKRLHVLIDSMKKVRKGEFQFDITVRGGGEVGELAHHFRKMLRKINELIAEAVNKKAASKETELKSLKNQIDSHFLYNTLENIKMMAEIEGHYPVSDALTSLGGLMRYNLKWTSEYVRLRDEVGHITNYVAIMNVRYERKVNLRTDIPERYLDQELLKMSLQPIVENAVKHGLDMAAGRELTITIRAEEIDGIMIISITDDGCGMTDRQTAQLNGMIAAEEPDADWRSPAGSGDTQKEGSGIGLRNVHQRIRLYYGKEHGLFVESGEGRYTRVILTIPYFILTGGAA